MDNLEGLSNDDLRLRLLEYGFANMPVTTTTRKVLIKKLRNAMDGAKSKTRRETVSVTKYSSEESESETDSKKVAKKADKQNRRATIAAPVAQKEIRAIAKPVSRRSGRVTPLTVPKSVLSVPEHSDDDINIILEEPEPRSRTKSRSPSLQTSAVVTTSYKQMIQPVLEQDEDPVIFEEEAENGVSKQYEIKKPTERNVPIAFIGSSTTKAARVLGEYDIGTSQSDNLRRMTINGGGSSVPSFRSASPKVTSLFTNYEAASSSNFGSGSGTAYKRRYTTNTATSTYNANSGNDDDDDDDDDADLLNEAPFLSNFTRRLAELKAEPLVAPKIGIAKASTSSTAYRQTGDYYRTYSDRKESRPIARTNRKETISGTFVTYLRSIEGYIRWPLLVVLAILAAIFIYVIFFDNQ